MAKSERNQSIECARMIAAFFVLFIHCPFPGRLGKLITSVARFAVPMFFLISGYFSYKVGRKKLAGRVRRMLWLNLAATALYILKRYLLESQFSWGFREAVWELAPGKTDLLRWLLLSFNPYAEHLWYLAAIFTCYGLLFLYVSFFDDEKIRYQPLYGFCAWLFSLQFLLGEMGPMAGLSVEYVLIRNALLPGLPLFTLGIFLREYGPRLRDKFSLSDGRLLCIALLGLGYSLYFRTDLRGTETPSGMVIAAAALLLMMADHPRLPVSPWFGRVCISKFGFLSAAVYIVHPFFDIFYEPVFGTLAGKLFGGAAPMLRPIVILAVSLASSAVLEHLCWLGKRVGRKIGK